MKNNQPAQKITVNRNSENGQFVTERYAEKHPKTTETEHYKKNK